MPLKYQDRLLLPQKGYYSLCDFLCRLSSILTNPATPWGLSHVNTSIMWSATLISLCLEFSTTPFLRKSLYMNESSNICAVVVGMTFIYQKRNHFLHIASFFYVCSPSICHSDSDLSEGSRKYSPSSETSVETQRACGKTDIIIKRGNLHTRRQASMHVTWQIREEVGSRTSQMVSQMFFLNFSATQITDW